MPVHDWTRVNAGIFHDFHETWIIELKRALNGGILPADYYALAEQVAGSSAPDVLTLPIDAPDDNGANGPSKESPSPAHSQPGGIALAAMPPKRASAARWSRTCMPAKLRL